MLGQDAEDAACAAGNAARYGTVSSSPFTQKTPSQEAYAAMRREGISEEMAKAALNNPQFQRLLQEGLSFDAEVQQSEAYHAQMLREDLEAQQSGGILRLTVGPNHITATDMALEYFQKAAVFTTEHPHLTAATFYGLQAAIGGPLNVLRGMVQDVLIGDQRDAIRQVLKTSIANHLGITDQSDTTDQLKFDIAFTSGEFGFSFLLGAGIKVVKDSAQNVAKAIRREERALQPSVTSSKKRAAPSELPVTPRAKASRTKDKASPGASGETSQSVKKAAQKEAKETARTPVGRRGQVMKTTTQNSPQTINGTKFTGHALDQMQARGITSPTAIIDVIKNPGQVFPGNTPGTTVFIRENLKVVTNNLGDIVTVITQ